MGLTLGCKIPKDSSLGEASAREYAATRKRRETPMGQQAPSNQGDA